MKGTALKPQTRTTVLRLHALKTQLDTRSCYMLEVPGYSCVSRVPDERNRSRSGSRGPSNPRIDPTAAQTGVHSLASEKKHEEAHGHQHTPQQD